jgi:hypothetical protein
MGRRVSVLALSALALTWAFGGRVHAQGQDAAGGPPVAVEVPPDGVVQELELADGSRLFGRVEGKDGAQVVFRTSSGVRLELTRGEIRSLRVRDRPHQGDLQPSDPNRTRLFFGPTARALPRGRGYLGVYELFVPFVQVGVTDRITVGGGTPLVFGDDGDSRPFWLTPKVQLLRGERTQVAAGLMHFVFTGDEDPVGIAYGVVTHGTSDASVTGGFGYGYASSERESWIGMVGGDKRVGRGVKLLAEGYVWQGGEGILMGGVRLFGARLSADLGLATFVGGDDSFVFPIVNVVWTF